MKPFIHFSKKKSEFFWDKFNDDENKGGVDWKILKSLRYVERMRKEHLTEGVYNSEKKGARGKLGVRLCVWIGSLRRVLRSSWNWKMQPENDEVYKTRLLILFVWRKTVKKITEK